MFSIVTESEITIHTVYNNDKCHVCTLRAPHARHSNTQFVPLQVTERTHTSHQLMSKTLTNLNFQNPTWRTRPQNHKLLGRSKYYLTCSLPLDASCLVGFLYTHHQHHLLQTTRSQSENPRLQVVPRWFYTYLFPIVFSITLHNFADHLAEEPPILV